MPPTVGMAVKVKAGFAVGFWWDDGDGAPGVEFGPEPVGVEGPVTKQGTEGDAFDQGRHADCVVALTWQQDEARQVAEPIDEGNDLGRQAATRAANGLILSPPLAPLAFWWAVTMVPSIKAYSKSGSSDTRSKMRSKTSARTQRRKR